MTNFHSFLWLSCVPLYVCHLLHFWSISCIHLLFFVPDDAASVWVLLKQFNVISCQEKSTTQSILFTEGKGIYPKLPIWSAKNISATLHIYLMALEWPSRGLTWAQHTFKGTCHESILSNTLGWVLEYQNQLDHLSQNMALTCVISSAWKSSWTFSKKSFQTSLDTWSIVFFPFYNTWLYPVF